MSYIKTPHTEEQIVETELILPFDASKIAKQLTEASGGAVDYTTKEWSPEAAETSVVWTDARRIIQIMPGFQNAAQLMNAQVANPGSWNVSDPERVRWADVKNRDTNTPGGASNVDFMAMAAKPEQAYRAEVLRLLHAILAK